MNEKKITEFRHLTQQRRESVISEVDSILADDNLLDIDGYPTRDCLRAIEIWDWEDASGWFEFIKSVWHLASWGWHEAEVKDDNSSKTLRQYNISTAGWSGNEDIIEAMMKNNMLWSFCWVQSRRGGHYIFENDLGENQEQK